MAEWNFLKPEDKIFKWRDFRVSLNNKTRMDILKEISIFFSVFPISSRYIDYYTPSSWPDPWDILCYSLYCPNTISLMIYYTLVFVGIENVKVLLVEDKEDRYILPIVDGVYVLNYELGEICEYKEIKKFFKVLDVYDEKDIGYIS